MTLAKDTTTAKLTDTRIERREIESALATRRHARFTHLAQLACGATLANVDRDLALLDEIAAAQGRGAETYLLGPSGLASLHQTLSQTGALVAALGNWAIKAEGPEDRQALLRVLLARADHLRREEERLTTLLRKQSPIA